MKFQLHGFVLTDCSFRHKIEPFSGARVEGPYPPSPAQIEVELAKAQEPNRSVVKVRVVIDAPDGRYAVSVAYAAMLTLDLEGEEPPEDLDSRIMVTGASMSFPYCRELISNLTSRARFGPLWLAPQDFNSLLRKKEAASATDG